MSETTLPASPAAEGPIGGASPLDPVPPRTFIPSEREVEGGLADYEFTPVPAIVELVQAAPTIGARLRALRTQFTPWSDAPGIAKLPLLLLGADALFSQWDDVAFATLLPDIRDDFGFDAAFLLTLSSVLSTVIVLFTPVTGFIADRVNRIWMLAIGNVVQDLGSIVASRAGSLTSLGVSRAVGGVGGAISNPTQIPLLSDWYPLDIRARVVSFVFLLGGLGRLVGPVIAGTLGAIYGWRPTVLALGIFAAIVSCSFFFLKDPVRGGTDRRRLGADEEAVSRPQKPVSWSEGWRAASSVLTLRRIWFATPFLLAVSNITVTLLSLYYADEFGVGPFGRGFISSATVVGGLIGLAFSGKLADRLLVTRPGRVFALIGLFMTIGAIILGVLAVSPFLWLSVLVSLPLGALNVVVYPALLTLVSLVVPARLRAFGVATLAPWQLAGNVLVVVIVNTFNFDDVRVGLLICVPLNIIGALLIGSAGRGVEADMRSALAAAMADEEARRARDRGRNKMLICRGIDVAYDGNQVLFGVDLDVEEGELIALLGTNGAGKSTLLRAIAGVQEATGGAIFYNGDDITHRPTHQTAADGVVYMPGGQAVFPGMTVKENLEAAAWVDTDEGADADARLERVFELFPVLRDRLGQAAGTMSGGEQQMVALGQALLMRPRLLMIDELSLGLSPAVVGRLLEVVRAINAEGTTVILVEQSVNVALTIAKRAVFMEKGEVRFDGSTVDLLDRRDLLRSVFLAGAETGGSGGSPFLAAKAVRRPIGDDEAPVEPVLAVADVRVSYGGHQVLDGTSLEVVPSEVVGIIGPNGAGKTTLFDAISGYTPLVGGRVVVGGVDCAGMTPDTRARLGVARSFQSARLFPSLTVREAVSVALEQHLASRSVLAAAAWLPKHRASERRTKRRVENLVGLMNLDGFADSFVRELSTGTRRMVDVACIMAAEPKLLLLDEPSSGLAQAEVEVLAPVVRRLARETECGVLVIEHDIPLVTSLSDRMIAMVLGRVLVEGVPDDVVNHPEVVASYLGGDSAAVLRSGAGFIEQLVRGMDEPS